MAATTPQRNKALVLRAFDALFNQRDYAAAASFWSNGYIQHGPHIPPDRGGLFDFVRSLPETHRYENSKAVAEDGKFAEHWAYLKSRDAYLQGQR